MTHSNAAHYLEGVGRMRPLAEEAHSYMVDLGCTSYVKTIYIGYDVGGEMVAALYAHSDHVEIALALPEDADDRLLVDAGHLTWRTLPVAAILRRKADLAGFRDLAATACERVRTASHEVMRDNDFFSRRRERRLASD